MSNSPAYIEPINSDVLLSEATNENLYLNLIEQINKDFNLANESIDLSHEIHPEGLKSALHEKIYRLIQYNFAEYLNLLYIVDVPEEQIKALDGSDISELSKQVAFLVLKREWMKVWFRTKF